MNDSFQLNAVIYKLLFELVFTKLTDLLYLAQAAYDMSYMNVRPTIPHIFPRPLAQLIQTGWALSPEVIYYYWHSYCQVMFICYIYIGTSYLSTSL